MATEEPEAVSTERIRDKADVRGQSIQARLRLESEEVEKSTLIREWQDTTAEQPSVGSGSIICRLFDSCIGLLRSIVKCSKGKDGSHGNYMQLQESLVALSLWSEDHYLSTGDLDTQLNNSEGLRELMYSLLLSLADLIVNGLLQHIVTSPAERHASLFKYNVLSLMHEARNEIGIVETPVDYTRDHVSNMAATLATLVDCLISLSQSIEQSKQDDYNQHSGHYKVIEDRPPYLYHVERIKSKFPIASPSLLERLGKCNWERYLRLQERRETVKDEEHLRSEEMESKSGFYDSALGTSMPAQSELGGGVSTYAETVVSSRAASSHQKLPKLPIEGRKGKKFICQVCNRVVAIRYSQDWKKHVFQDLSAYTCIYEGCLGLSLWEDRHAMTNHLAVEHGLGPEWKNHPCPLCRHHTGEGKELISLHVSRHMEEIALSVLPVGCESDSEEEENASLAEISHSTSGQEQHNYSPGSQVGSMSAASPAMGQAMAVSGPMSIMPEIRSQSSTYDEPPYSNTFRTGSLSHPNIPYNMNSGFRRDTISQYSHPPVPLFSSSTANQNKRHQRNHSTDTMLADKAVNIGPIGLDSFNVEIDWDQYLNVAEFTSTDNPIINSVNTAPDSSIDLIGSSGGRSRDNEPYSEHYSQPQQQQGYAQQQPFLQVELTPMSLYGGYQNYVGIGAMNMANMTPQQQQQYNRQRSQMIVKRIASHFGGNIPPQLQQMIRGGQLMQAWQIVVSQQQQAQDQANKQQQQGGQNNVSMAGGDMTMQQMQQMQQQHAATAQQDGGQPQNQQAYMARLMRQQQTLAQSQAQEQQQQQQNIMSGNMGMGMGWQAQQAFAAPEIAFGGDLPPSVTGEDLFWPPVSPMPNFGSPEDGEDADGGLDPLTLGSPAVDNSQQQRRDHQGLILTEPTLIQPFQEALSYGPPPFQDLSTPGLQFQTFVEQPPSPALSNTSSQNNVADSR